MAAPAQFAAGFDQLDAPEGSVRMETAPPSTPEDYYGAGSIASDEWRGGEMFFHNGSGTGSSKLYIQTATSGRTPTWRTIATQFTDA